MGKKEVINHLNLQRKYGVVRFVGTVQHNSQHELTFQSDDPLYAMQKLQEKCATVDAGHGYMLIIE
jgi:hypothetical protein